MILCIYHGNCADGFTAAWVVWKRFGNKIKFHPGVYQDPPPDVTGHHVLMVDFSYKRSTLLDMATKAKTILILDHHKTAAEDLAGFPEPAPYADWQNVSLNLVIDGNPPIAALFDMDRSGAGITWDYFFPDIPRPQLLNHVEDRDLWRFSLPRTREIQAAMFSRPYDFATWEQIMGLPTDALAQEGEAIERKHHKDVAELVTLTKRKMMIGGYLVPVANLPHTMTSDAGHALAQGEPFAACYWDTADGRVFSLRSSDMGMDVAAIAKGYGGGGHRNASGFRVSFDCLGADGSPPTQS